VEESGDALETTAEAGAPPLVESSGSPAALEARTVDVHFRVSGRARAFDTGGLALARYDPVVVDGDRGPELGEVLGVPRPRWPSEVAVKLPRVLRIADEHDLKRADHNRLQEHTARRLFLDRARQLRLEVKLVRVDYRFDGGKAVFYFMSRQRIDFRHLVRDLAQALHTRVEMRQIGDRDETRLVGGLGPCGRELCCSSWLREFDAVSIKMAKAQDLSLNPSKLAGMCGRLKCCLRYEYETYVSLRRSLPKVGRTVQTVKGDGEVVKQILLKQRVLVRRAEDDVVVECSLEDLVERRPDSDG
jgi:cell fate regulator YaaT (PSP1 superfamily)